MKTITITTVLKFADDMEITETDLKELREIYEKEAKDNTRENIDTYEINITVEESEG